MVNKKTPNKEMENIEIEKQYNRFLEEIKIANDYLKHIATLGTGSIVIMATFMQRFTEPIIGKYVTLSIIFMLMSLVSIVGLQTLFAIRLSYTTDDIKRIPGRTHRRVYLTTIMMAYIFFLAGLLVLGLLIINLNR
jgi:hypothetical protein